MAVTIKEVAQRAGCSIKTVSRVVNDEPHVKPALRERVLNVITELGYIPNISARQLVQKKSYVICILLHSSGAFQSTVISKVLDLGYEGNYEILVQTYYPSFSRSRDKITALIRQKRIDGLVTTPPCDSDPFLIDLIKTTGIAHVHIAPLQPTGGTPYVSAEDFTGAYQMTEHLIQHGHQRIGLLMGLRNHRSSLDRLFGYKAAVEANVIPFDVRYLVDSENNFPGGYNAARILMGLQEPPTAIFALSDEAAAGALYALNELKIDVPRQVSLAAFGDITHSNEIWPGVSVVKYPLEKIVEKSVRMLIELVEGRQPDERQVIFPTEIIERGSIRSIPVPIHQDDREIT
ncbi:MAG: LacI family DNA-binding transcriptional regulator [Anaerolineaceae bacterium]|nr:LacI family DNA-binding transcriptional regulator [Anaerolineaceae bacterium]